MAEGSAHAFFEALNKKSRFRLREVIQDVTNEELSTNAYLASEQAAYCRPENLLSLTTYPGRCQLT